MMGFTTGFVVECASGDGILQQIGIPSPNPLFTVFLLLFFIGRAWQLLLLAASSDNRGHVRAPPFASVLRSALRVRAEGRGSTVSVSRSLLNLVSRVEWWHSVTRRHLLGPVLGRARGRRRQFPEEGAERRNVLRHVQEIRQAPGRVVQVDPIKPTLKSPKSKRLKQINDGLL